ncbi:hypothetical protein [Mesobacillus harenae]|uniref:hypothetical protein n=1 Tax=Mesobacillus harenae TaxID=2213203 RepID=UPI0015810D5E|nr:hypothetical protein [Mesobacillus harenae]
MSISFSQTVILLIILIGPLLYPLLSKKRTWLTTITIGYGAYILWGIYLYVTSDITDFGTGYGLFCVPYIIGLSILGAILERNQIKAQKA